MVNKLVNLGNTCAINSLLQCINICKMGNTCMYTNEKRITLHLFWTENELNSSVLSSAMLLVRWHRRHGTHMATWHTHQSDKKTQGCF